MRIGSVNYCTSQGLGHLMKDFYDNGVVTDVMMVAHGSRTNHPEWYPPGTPMITSFREPDQLKRLFDFCGTMGAMLFFETPFYWPVLAHCRAAGVRTYIVPMYECTPRQIPFHPHRWLCPSLLDVQYFPGNPMVEVPVKVEWKQRTTAKRFLHNAGNLGLRNRNGTREILQAMKYVKSPVEMTVRAQDVRGMAELLNEFPQQWKDSRVKFKLGTVPREELFSANYDVFIMAEKFNGLSLPLREARAAGMLVMTSNRFPMNTWLPSYPLIHVHDYQKASISRTGAYMEYDEAIIRPLDIAMKIDEIYGQDISAYSVIGGAWARELSWERLKPVWMEELSR